jgi:hypothetical protein
MKNKLLESHTKWRVSNEMNIDEKAAALNAGLN